MIIGGDGFNCEFFFNAIRFQLRRTSAGIAKRIEEKETEMKKKEKKIGNKSQTSILMMISDDEFMTVWHKIVSSRVIIGGLHLLFACATLCINACARLYVFVYVYVCMFAYSISFVNLFSAKRASR